MLIKPAALLSTLVACSVSCATGSVVNLPEPSPSVTPPAPAISPVETPEDPPATQAPTPPPAPSTEVAGSYSLDVACADLPMIHLCILGSSADKDVTFTLPPGTKRSSIVYTITPVGPSAGGSVSFAGTDPLDATVHMHAYAGAFSSVHVEVTGVTAVPE